MPPTHVFQSLPYGEFLRVRRNYSTLSSFNHFSDIILEAFIRWGYDRYSLLTAQEQARDVDRSSLLEPKANLHVSHRTDTSNLNSPTDQFFFILDHHQKKNPPVSQTKLDHPRDVKHYQWPISIGSNLWSQKKSTTTWFTGTFQYTTKTHLWQKGQIQKCLLHSTLQILCQHWHLRADQIEKTRTRFPHQNPGLLPWAIYNTQLEIPTICM